MAPFFERSGVVVVNFIHRVVSSTAFHHAPDVASVG